MMNLAARAGLIGSILCLLVLVACESAVEPTPSSTAAPQVAGAEGDGSSRAEGVGGVTSASVTPIPSRAALLESIVTAAPATASPVPSRVPLLEGIVTATSTPARAARDQIPTATPLALEPTPDNGVIELATVRRYLLDPLANSLRNDFLPGEIYSGLVRFDGDIAGEVVPDLARSWTIDEGGTSYTFAMREDLRFSDGSPLTAEDVKWSWERALAPRYLTEPALEAFGAIRGAAEMINDEATSLVGVVALDDQTLRVELTRPQAHFLELLALPVASVLRRENVVRWGTINWTKATTLMTGVGVRLEDLDFDDPPVGSGPYRVSWQEYRVGVVLEPNPFYHKDQSEAPEIRLFRPDGARGDFEDPDFPGSRSDVRLWGWGLYPLIGFNHEFSILTETESGDTTEYIVDFTGSREFRRAPEVSYLAFNSSIPPYDDVEFRRALRSSMRWPQQTDFNPEDLPRTWATGLLPPNFRGGGRSLTTPIIDEHTARLHMAASAHSDGDLPTGLEFHNDDGLESDVFFASLSTYWRDWLGLEFNDTSRRINWTILEHARQLAAGTLQMRYVHVKPRYPSPCAILCRIPDLFGPKAHSEETEEVREMLHDAAATADPVARLAKYRAIEEHVLDRALVIPITWDDGTELLSIKPWISGYKLPAYGGSQYEDVVVDTTHPEYPAGR